MSWTCTFEPAARGERTVSNHKSPTGARREAARKLLTHAVGVLSDDGAWAPRTTKQLRADSIATLRLIEDVLAYDGPVIVEFTGGRIQLDQQPDAPAKTNGHKSTVSKTEARWLASTRFPQACPNCSGEVPIGVRAWYDPKVGLFHEHCAPAEVLA